MKEAPCNKNVEADGDGDGAGYADGDGDNEIIYSPAGWLDLDS